MRVLFAFAAAPLVFCCTVGRAQAGSGGTKENESYQSDGLSVLKKKAELAHNEGRFNEEVDYRQRFSEKIWETFAVNPNSMSEYDRYGVIESNDLPLGLLLEGSRRLAEAEAVFRHAGAELAVERIAGDDIKSENQLYLAHLLKIEGKVQEAEGICSHWKGRMRRLARGQDSAHIYGIPKAPLRDTPEAEIARWDLACGDPGQGLKAIEEQISAHPQMLFSYTILSRYYYARGDFQRAYKIESDGVAAITGR